LVCLFDYFLCGVLVMGRRRNCNMFAVIYLPTFGSLLVLVTALPVMTSNDFSGVFLPSEIYSI